MTAMLFSLVLFVPAAEMEPMTEEQLTRLRTLVRETQEKSAALQKQLEAKQAELARLYDDYALNERAALKTQEEILELQRRLLANHHKMQTALREIVGKDRFDVLKQRLKRALAPKENPPPRPKTSTNPSGE